MGIDASLYPITTTCKKRENSMTTCDFFKDDNLKLQKSRLKNHPIFKIGCKGMKINLLIYIFQVISIYFQLYL